MTDIFDAKILCKNCNIEMKPAIINKNGFELRAMKCDKCHDKIIHPADLNASSHFNDLKGKTFSVKLRMVGNSHAVSIPKEIVDFMNEMNDVHERGRRIRSEIDNMVRLCFEDFGRLSLRFGEFGSEEDEEDKEADGFEEGDEVGEENEAKNNYDRLRGARGINRLEAVKVRRIRRGD